MPLPKGYLPREGDVLIVYVTVKHTVDPGETSVLVVEPGRKYSSMSVDLTDIGGIHRRNWEPGDLCRFGGDAVTVLATDDEQAWIKFDNGTRQSVHVNALEAEPTPVESDIAFEEPVAPPPAPRATTSGDIEEIEF